MNRYLEDAFNNSRNGSDLLNYFKQNMDKFNEEDFEYILQRVNRKTESYARSSFSEIGNENARQKYKIDQARLLSYEKELQKAYERLGNATTEEDRTSIQNEINDLETKWRSLDARNRSNGGKVGSYVKYFEEIVSSLKNFWGIIRQFNDPWTKIDHAASQYSKTIGQTSQQYAALRKNTIANVREREIGIKYNTSTEDLIKAQQDYAVGAGRNIAVSKEDQENLAAMTAVYGNKANELAVLFEKFGVGLTNTSEHLGDMFNKAAKSGISLEKYVENVRSGLAMAQTYTFAGGLKSMERMAQHAAKIHMDMEQIRALADRSGNVEGAITTAAKMQVLGGPFASMADPLGMLSESWGDMEGLAKRLENITKTMGHFNRATGEVEVDAFNRQRLRAYAEATGQDYGRVMETVHQQAKLGEIRSQINSSSAAGLSNEMKELIENTATFKNGRAGVTINGEFKTLDQLKEGDKKELEKLQQTEAQDIKQIANDLASLKDRREGFTKQFENAMATISEGFLGHIEKSLTTLVGGMTTLLVSVAGIGLIAKLFMGGANVIQTIRGNRVGGRSFSKMKERVGEGNVAGTPRRISNKTNKKGFKATKGGETKNISKPKKIQGPKEISKVQKIGEKQLQSLEKTKTFGKNLSKSGGLKGKTGNLITKYAGKQEAKLAGKEVNKRISSKMAQTAGKKLVTKGIKGGGVGFIGAMGNIGTDIALEKGLIKNGGVMHGAFRIGSTAAEGAGMGMMLAPLLGPLAPIAPAMGAAAGAIVGAVKFAKETRTAALDKKLAQMGIERKGDYGAKKLKKIDKALTTGKISRKVRRKMEREGDFEMLAQIDAAKEQKREEKIARKEKRKSDRLERIKARNGNSETVKRIRHATFYVDVANFEGRAFGVKKIKPNTNNGVSILSAPQESLSNTARILTNSNSRNNLNSQNIGPNKIEPIDININGTLKLEGKGGQSIDIIDMLKKDKTLEKAIIDLLAPSIEKEIRNRKVGGGSAANNQSYGDSAR